MNKVKIVPAFIDTEIPEGNNIIDLKHDVGHSTVGFSMGMRNGAELPAVHEVASAFVTTLPRLLGSTIVDILLISPSFLCDAMSAGRENAPMQCRRCLNPGNAQLSE